MSEPDYFSEDYSIARRRFREGVERAGGELVGLPIEAQGPAGEALSVDVGWFGAPRPERILVHSSGVHGVEAFAGSAVQLAWLGAARPSPASAAALALVHVVNPFGMAWHRRVNAQNVDLNRNCLPPGESYAGAPTGYGALNGWLNPARSSAFDLFLPHAVTSIARFGMATVKQSVAAGQYAYPEGLFFGGHSLQEEPRRLLSLMRERLAEARTLVALDVHTGLGPFGQDTFLIDARTDQAVTAALRTQFGDRVAVLDPAKGPAYTPRGLYETIFHLAAPHASRICVGQEFGTHSPLSMLKILRRENTEFFHRAGGVSATTRRALQDAFVPRDPRWRSTVVARGVEALERLSDFARLYSPQ